jgi:hypothetical protein
VQVRTLCQTVTGYDELQAILLWTIHSWDTSNQFRNFLVWHLCIDLLGGVYPLVLHWVQVSRGPTVHRHGVDNWAPLRAPLTTGVPRTYVWWPRVPHAPVAHHIIGVWPPGIPSICSDTSITTTRLKEADDTNVERVVNLTRRVQAFSSDRGQASE